MDFVNLIKDGLKYATTDLKRVIIGGLLTIPGMYLLLIPFIFVLGYCYRSMQETISGNDVPPDFNEWGNLFKKGIGLIGVSIIYGVPVWILMFGLLYASGAFSTVLETGWYPLWFYCLELVLCLTYGVFVTVAVLRYADKGNFGSAFNFGDIFDSLKKGYMDYVAVMILLFIVMILLAIPVAVVAVILMMTVIGIVIAIPLVGALFFCILVLEYRVFANIYRETNKL